GKSSASKAGVVTASMYLQIEGARVLLMAQGMPSFLHGISWPTTAQPQVLGGLGEIQSISGGNPSAGDEAVITMPDHLWLKMKAFWVTLVTDGNAADRHVRLNMFKASGADTYSLAPKVITASLTTFISAVAGGTAIDGVSKGFVQLSLPDELWVPPEYTITTETADIQVGDNYGAPIASGHFISNPI
ncbi:hypothetical protein LCGC14_2394200, partial [marine sediment metagenome]